MKYFRITFTYTFEDGRTKSSAYLVKCLDAEEQERKDYLEDAFKNQCLFDLGYIPENYTIDVINYTLAQFNTFIQGTYQEIVVDNINPGYIFE